MLTFSSKQMELTEGSVCTIHRQAVEMLEEYKYLGTTFDSALKFTSNSIDTLRKCQQQQYLLRKLSSFGISKEIPRTFYWTLIGSLLTFSIICWYNVISPAVENSAVDTSENLVSNYLTTNQRAFIPEQQTLNTACRILQDPFRTVPRAQVAVETPVMISMLQDKEENNLCLDDHSAP